MLALNKVDFTLTRRTASVRAFNLQVGTAEVRKKMKRDFEILLQTERGTSEVTFSLISAHINQDEEPKNVSPELLYTKWRSVQLLSSCCYHELL